jgi:hypothetical protein
MFSPGWHLITILPASFSRVARITNLSLHTWFRRLRFFFFVCVYSALSLGKLALGCYNQLGSILAFFILNSA